MPFGLALTGNVAPFDILSFFRVLKAESELDTLERGRAWGLCELFIDGGKGLRSEATGIMVHGSRGPLLTLEAESGGEKVGEIRPWT